MPFAGEASKSLLGGIVVGLGLTSVGAALHLRSRRKAAEHAANGEAPEETSSLSDISSLPLDEDLPS